LFDVYLLKRYFCSLEWFDPQIGQNPEQVQAVQHIVCGTSQPSPYIIFGPPGTGKTSTVVESICQLWKTSPKAKILVTAQSNAACNEIMQRLLAVIPPSHLYRMFAPSMENKFDTIDDALLAVSNLKYGYHEWTSWSEFYAYRIVVCTLTTAGRLVQARIERNHFTHVFIDECGSASEPSALIPIAGVLTTHQKMSGHIILAGDIKQLGPIVKSSVAESLGYGKFCSEK
jgi:helicase MOV-10